MDAVELVRGLCKKIESLQMDYEMKVYEVQRKDEEIEMLKKDIEQMQENINILDCELKETQAKYEAATF